MKSYLILIVFFIVPLLTFAQQITGKVYRMDSDSAVANASIYFGGSIKGTSTNGQGFFTLATPATKAPLIVSCVGYYSTTVSNYGTDKPLSIYLKPKENVMREVLIGSDGMTRAEKLRIFRREFIGTSEYALSCDILNPDDIDLRYDKDSETLTAFCSKPIIVKNNRLGYIITYYLDNFERNGNHLIFAGNYQFKEADVTDATRQKRTNNNRESVYIGSRMQFIRALWNNKLDRAGFEVFDNDYHNIPIDSIVYINKTNEKFIRPTTRMRIAYRSNYAQITFMHSADGATYIGQNGFYGTGLQWSGLMSRQRIGDMLPFEYESPREKDKPKKP